MTDRIKKLLAEAAALPSDERAELVHELARTLPEGYESTVRLGGTDEESPIPAGVVGGAFPPRRRAGTAAGRVHLAADFDAPLEDFADYS